MAEECSRHCQPGRLEDQSIMADVSLIVRLIWHQLEARLTAEIISAVSAAIQPGL